MNNSHLDTEIKPAGAFSRREVLGSSAVVIASAYAMTGLAAITEAANPKADVKASPQPNTPSLTLEQRNLQATKTYYAASGNWELIAPMLTEDFHATESPSLPMAGTYRGIEGLKKLYTTLLVEMIDATRYDIYQMMAGGDWVVSLMNVYARDTDGSEIELSIAESLRWRDGKLCEMKPYWFDGGALVRAVEAKKRAKTG